MSQFTALAEEKVWFEKWRYDDAEIKYQENLAGSNGENETFDNEELHNDESLPTASVNVENVSSRISNRISPKSEIHELNKVSQKETLLDEGFDKTSLVDGKDLFARVRNLEQENSSLKEAVSKLNSLVVSLTSRLSSLETSCKVGTTTTSTPVPVAKKEQQQEDDDEEVDLFGSDDEEEDANAARIREERLKQYSDKKAKKAGPIAKSSVLLDVKPWDDETSLKDIENECRKIKMDGLVWGAAKSAPMAYGICKLQILCTVEDEKVSIDDLTQKIEEVEDYVQSVDIAAFNKI